MEAHPAREESSNSARNWPECGDSRCAHRRTADSFKMKGFGVDVSGSGSGPFVGIVIAIVFFLAALVYFIAQHDKNMVRALEKLEQAQERSNKITEAMLYVISRPNNEKELLNIGKPALIKEIEQKGK